MDSNLVNTISKQHPPIRKSRELNIKLVTFLDYAEACDHLDMAKVQKNSELSHSFPIHVLFVR